ncbi:MAG TPA: site-specific DNA-methyltransferase [Ilumatobacteraceae bacterium]|nr:site-specific DNA-methyltransferase [Ilumatobacteraceae bacterium]
MHSPDLTATNIDKIAELFPNVITEAVVGEGDAAVVERAIDFDLLRQELSDHVVEGPKERYQLDWPGKRAAAFAANTPIAKTLRPVRAESVDFDTTKNLFIEGDNLDALKLLQESYLGKVKLIYIDPPYNTGNDFIYNDDFAETTEEYLAKSGQTDEEGTRLVANTESNGRFHSDWLSMMYPRLKLARNLLTDDGVIFISIDDHEVDNLKRICCEIFGSQNFLGLVTRSTGTPTGGGFDGFSNLVDYLLVFRRSEASSLAGLEFSDVDASIYNEQDERGFFLTRSLRRTGGEDRREDRPSMYFPVEAPDGSQVFPVGPEGYESRWRCGRDHYLAMVEEGLIAWKQTERSGSLQWHPYQKFYLDGRAKRPSTLWLDLDGNKKATRELREIFESEKVFDSPKPVALLERIIQIGMTPESTVLDFFAGSGTTAAAVLNANAADGGNRSFVLIQLPEEIAGGSAAVRMRMATIADVTRERIRRHAAGLVGRSLLPGSDTGFRALRLDSSSAANALLAPDVSSQSQLGLDIDNIKADRTGEDLLFQVLLDWGLELSLPINIEELSGHGVFVVEDGALIACFDQTVSLDVVRSIAERQPLRAVFRDSAFADDAARINAEQMFREVSPATDVKVL